MTNETYLYVSYFAAVVLGLGLAAVTVTVLRKPLEESIRAENMWKLSLLVRRVFSFWVFVAVLLAFISVSYIDCSHESYAKVVADRNYLIDKTQQHVSRMSIALAVALFTYGIGLALFLWASVRSKLRRPTSQSV